MHVTFSLNIDSGDDAFQEDPGSEVARILRAVALRVDGQFTDTAPVYDRNGNKVGVFSYRTIEGR